jgi:hypothetical protein
MQPKIAGRAHPPRPAAKAGEAGARLLPPAGWRPLSYSAGTGRGRAGLGGQAGPVPARSRARPAITASLRRRRCR